ncbi:hypothetical protein HDU89_003610 [Geranomyces variabilis]|nr:hypothetical protein HDU89_003610 [Geranomyces variabilis]
MPRPRSTSVPPPPTRSETREYIGFAIYLASFVAFVLYLAWAVLPDAVLHALGLSYYPTRWWALALPVWVLGLIPFIPIAFTGINLLRTPGLQALDTISEPGARVLQFPVDGDKLLKLGSEDSIPELEDIPLSTINQILYP